MDENGAKYLPGVGLDVGTSFLQVARQPIGGGNPEFRAERDAFFTIYPATPTNAKFIEKSLRQGGTFTLKSEGKFYVVGRHAIDMANVRQDKVERPLKKGVLSDSERDTFGMLAVMIKSLLGPAVTPNELCVYTYPADPLDEDFDIIYHKNRMAEILTDLNYAPKPLLEPEALAYSELTDNDLTGIVISCGAGMHNVSMFHMGENLLSFSVAKGGDYIDQQVAKQMKISETVAQQEKESGVDLLNPKDKIANAISIYSIALMQYVVDSLEIKFRKVEKLPIFQKPIPVVLAGGTCLPSGYLEKMDELLRTKQFPFTIGEIKRASDPLRAVANGCLIYAQMELAE